MFKKSRRRIVASIMTILIIVWVGTLGIIYISSYIEMSKQNNRMLQAHADMYNLPPSFNMSPSDGPLYKGDMQGPKPGFIETPMFKLSIFYSVAVSYDGEILEIRNASPTVHTDADLEKLVKSIIDGNKNSGRIQNLSFYKTDKNGYILVAFIDNTVVNENALTLFRFTLVFGAMALILFFFVANYLARRIVKPLEESYQKQKQFISDAGHELKTPISVVNANAELLCREIGENQWLANIQYENERMGVLIKQLLDLARTESITMQMESIDFSHLVAGELLPFESIAYEKRVTLKSNIALDVFVEGNSSQLKQLTSILIDNAIRHGEENGETYISLSKEHGYAILTVRNKGEEIPKEQREKIFERFYRIDSVRNSEDKHYGLGLAIAKAIVISHQGKIYVKCYDGFVEFHVKIPVLQKSKKLQ